MISSWLMTPTEVFVALAQQSGEKVMKFYGSGAFKRCRIYRHRFGRIDVCGLNDVDRQQEQRSGQDHCAAPDKFWGS
jgi:hypothetical protein